MRKYMLVYQMLKEQIETEQLQAGQKISSIRSLSERLGVNKTTIIAALQMLEQQHLVYAVPKSGYYVMDHLKMVEPKMNYAYDFATATPTWHAFPFQDFQHCINKAIDTYQEELFNYGTPQGMPALLNEGRKLLEDYQVFSKPSQLFITSGIQQALFILSMMPFPNGGSTILVEEPTYHLYLQQLQTYNLSVKGIKRNTEGIDLEELERIFQQGDIKFFYTMPRFHNPLGCSYDTATIKAIVKLAKTYNVYLVEDDYLADFEYRQRRDPLYAFDAEEMVIYLKSFSKIMFPGLRLGLVVLPSQLVPVFQKFKNTTDIDSSMVSQAALALYLKSGMFAHYQEKVSKAYIGRAKVLQEALENHLPEIKKAAELVMHTSLKVPPNINLGSLIEDCRKNNVFIEAVNGNYLEGSYVDRILKLNVSNLHVDWIDGGIQLIAEQLRSSNHYFQ